MRCDWQNDKRAPTPCHVVDLDTGEVISPCAMADEETGEYKRYSISGRLAEGFYSFDIDPVTKRVKTISGRARIQIRPGYPPNCKEVNMTRDATPSFAGHPTLEEAVQSNPPRLVVKFKRDPNGGEGFEWGLLGGIPVATLIGGISCAQAKLIDPEVAADPIISCGEPVFAMIWDAERRKFLTFSCTMIPTLSLVGMLECVKSIIVASRAAQMVGAAMMQQSPIVGPDGRPMRT